MVKIHITGGKGFLGQSLRKALCEKFDISVSDVDTVNVLELKSLVDLFQKTKPDIVIHLAGFMGAQESKKRLYDYFMVNSFGVLNALEAMHRSGVKKMIFFSSLTVHGLDMEGQPPKIESDPFNPQHSYATSKIISEYVIRDYSKHYGIQSVILRPTIIVGNMAGEGNAVNEFVKDSLSNRPIVIYGKGEHKREWLSVEDLIQAVDQAILFLLRNQDGGCEDFIISSGEPISMKDLAQKCASLLEGNEIQFIDKNSQAFSLTSHPQKAKTVLGWEAKDTIEEIIHKVAQKNGAFEGKVAKR